MAECLPHVQEALDLVPNTKSKWRERKRRKKGREGGKIGERGKGKERGGKERRRKVARPSLILVSSCLLCVDNHCLMVALKIFTIFVHLYAK